jgi:transcriptional regulator with XRE-family HTH domain
MEENFSTRLRAAILQSGKIVKEIARDASLNKRTIDKWIGSSPTSPNVQDAVAIARNLTTTVEYLVDGEEGSEYVRKLVANEGGAYRPPSRIAPIVEDLSILTDSQVDDCRTIVHALASARKAKSAAEGTG